MAELNEKRKALLSREEKEKKYRDLLTDRIVKRTIYLMFNRREKGSIKYNQIMPEMITEKRAEILAWRDHIAELPGPSCKVYFPVCSMCGRIFTARAKNVGICSDDCHKEKARRYNFTLNKTKKGLKERVCNECGELFIPQYGDKRRGYCSNECMVRHIRRNGKHIRRERFKVAFRERVYKAQVYRRDGFRCQICHGKVNMKAKVPHPLAPTIDHIIALANGGKHEPSNVRLAHFMCNSCKGDRVTDGGDQLLLFG
jgi:5-methylcytosine-specific restriction endonuclease McrA